MSAALWQIVYCSRASHSGGRVEPEIIKILAVARANNEPDGITGAMLYRSGCFAQLLEGEAEVVERRFARICADQRHHNIVVLFRGAVQVRNFSAWAMGCGSMGDEQDVGGILARAFVNPDETTAMEVREMLKQSVAMTYAFRPHRQET